MYLRQKAPYPLGREAWGQNGRETKQGNVIFLKHTVDADVHSKLYITESQFWKESSFSFLWWIIETLRKVRKVASRELQSCTSGWKRDLAFLYPISFAFTTHPEHGKGAAIRAGDWATQQLDNHWEITGGLLSQPMASSTTTTHRLYTPLWTLPPGLLGSCRSTVGDEFLNWLSANMIKPRL